MLLRLKKNPSKSAVFGVDVFTLKEIPTQSTILEVPINKNYSFKDENFLFPTVLSVFKNISINFYKSNCRSFFYTKLKVTKHTYFQRMFFMHFNTPDLPHLQIVETFGQLKVVKKIKFEIFGK